MSSPIPDLILSGACDDELELIFEAARQRRTLVSERRALSLEPGDEFDITNIAPKKLIGAKVRFIRHEGSTVVTELVYGVDRNYPIGKRLLLRRSHVGQVYPK